MEASATDRPATVLSIAGSDSGGGAGIQADLKAFAACGVHGVTAITAITAQNTVAVEAVYPLPDGAIEAQVAAVVADITVDAVKVGMLGNAAIATQVERALDLLGETPVVVDPVMVAESGARLLDPGAQRLLVERILPRATVATPNLLEAAALADAPAGRSAAELARAVLALGPAAVVVTGGHGDEPIDLYDDGAETIEIGGPQHPGGAAHGSGCTHSAALAAGLALGLDPPDAARHARTVAAAAVRDGLRGVGAGAGPVDALGGVRAVRTVPPAGSARL